MRYLLRLNEIRHGSAVVDAESEIEAKEMASQIQFNFYDVKLTDLTVTPYSRDYIVTETCPHCMSEVEMYWNTEALGYKAFCPVCGERLMLCDECLHSNDPRCDYCSKTDSCKHNPEKAKR